MKAENYEETTIKDILAHMIEAWNRGSAQDFAAPFSDDADFIAFDGTHLKGRERIIEFHQLLFDTALKGTRLEGGVNFVRIIGPAFALMHSWITTTLQGQTNLSASRDSLQLFVLTKRGEEWRCDALLSARRITIEQQLFADEFATLSSRDQQLIARRVASMRH
jgi:uncharacterized protein (TIGR02246 family)